MPCKACAVRLNWFKQFKQLTADINKYSQELARLKAAVVEGVDGLVGSCKKRRRRCCFYCLGAGVFGGPEGFAGATIGGLVGGVPGSMLVAQLLVLQLET